MLNDKILSAVAKQLKKHKEKKELNSQFSMNSFKREGVITLFDKPYITRDGATLNVDMYIPEGAEKEHSGDKLPVVVAVHGGGFFLGDRKGYYPLGHDLASRGYILCAVSYRLLPEVRVYEQMSDVCAGMDSIIDYLEPYRVDWDRVYVMGESAGAYLATYVAALEHSGELQQVIGCEPSRLKIRSMILEFGMFYSNKIDIVKLITPSMYGKDDRAQRMKPYMNPEHPAIIGHFPPSLLITSDADFLKKYSYNFSKALTSHGIDNKLINMGKDKKLKHAFTVIHPEYEESKAAIDNADIWMCEH